MPSLLWGPGWPAPYSHERATSGSRLIRYASQTWLVQSKS